MKTSSISLSGNTAASQALAARGLDETWTRYGAIERLRHGRLGIAYPVIYEGGVTRRWKALDGQKPKNTWLDGSKPDACHYYIPIGIEALRAAVAAADGAIYIVNGEPALISCLAAGVQNALCWFGENSLPVNLRDFLTTLGVTCVYYPADKDKAGLNSAVRVRDALKGSGISFHSLQWGENVPDKGDVNDLWIAVGFDPDAFQSELANLDALPLPVETERKAQQRRDDYVAGSIEGKQEAIELAIARLTFQRQQKHGDWLNGCLCPFHDDHESSAGINLISGVLNCFACGKHSFKDVCAQLDIDWHPRSKTERRRKPGKPPAASTGQGESARSWFGGHFPNTWRWALRTLDDTVAHVVELIDCAAQAGDIALAGFTLGDLFACQGKHGFSIPKMTLCRALGRVRTIFSIIESDGEIHSNAKNDTASFYSLPLHLSSATEALLNALDLHYQLPKFTPGDFADFDDTSDTPALLAWRLNEDLDHERALAAEEALSHRAWWEKRLSWHKSTPLPDGWKIANTCDYGVAWLRALIAEQPDRARSYKQIASLLGISISSVKKYLDLAGAKNELQVVEIPVVSAADVRAAQRQHKARVCNYEAVYPDGKIARSYFASDGDFVEYHAAHGATVTVELQGASKQTIVRDTPPEKRPAPPPAATEPKTPMPTPVSPACPTPKVDRLRDQWRRWQLNRALRLTGTPSRGNDWILPTGEIVGKRSSARVLVAALLCVLDERMKKTNWAADCRPLEVGV